jgi:hypothetical protein
MFRVTYRCLGVLVPYVFFASSLHDILFSLFVVERAENSFIELLEEESFNLSSTHHINSGVSGNSEGRGRSTNFSKTFTHFSKVIENFS